MRGSCNSRSEEHTSELQSHHDLVCRLLLEVARPLLDLPSFPTRRSSDLSRIRAYGDVLFALRGLFDSSKEVTRNEFHQFAQALSLSERYPGVTNISFSFRVPHARKLQFEIGRAHV